MKSIIRQRREARAVCSICHSPDYRPVETNEYQPKPVFKCNQCGAEWSDGYDGGIYGELLAEEI